MDDNKRQRKRIHLIYYLRIFDTDSGADMGHLVDITPQGFMMVSEAPVPVGKEFSFRMELPNKVDGPEEVRFCARCLWCQQDFIPDYYLSGYQIKDMAPQEEKIITALINSYGFKSM
jgi:hypothetical protein